MRDAGSDDGLAPPWGVRAVAVVAALIVLVTAGWPAVSTAFSDRQPLLAGSVLAIGPDPAHSARLTAGQGWSLLKSRSDPKQGYSLRRGGVSLTVAYVALLGRGQAGDLWAGFRRIIQDGHPGYRLGRPRLITVSRSEAEDIGSLAEGALAGLGAIFPDPPADFAIEVTVLAPRDADQADRTAAARVVRSLRLAVRRP